MNVVFFPIGKTAVIDPSFTELKVLTGFVPTITSYNFFCLPKQRTPRTDRHRAKFQGFRDGSTEEGIRAQSARASATQSVHPPQFHHARRALETETRTFSKRLLEFSRASGYDRGLACSLGRISRPTKSFPRILSDDAWTLDYAMSPCTSPPASFIPRT